MCIINWNGKDRVGKTLRVIKGAPNCIENQRGLAALNFEQGF